MRHSRFFLSTILVAGGILGIARSASAQTPFQITVQNANTTQLVTNGSNINVAASGIGQSVQLVVTLTYTGPGKASLGNAQLFGSSTFTLTSAGNATLSTGGSASYQVVYTPQSGAQTSATVTIPYTETVGAASSNGAISLGFTGLTSAFILGYTIQPQGNAVALSNGGTIAFPPTTVGSSTIAILGIQNTGTAPGVLTSFSLSGSAFRTQGLPLLPGAIGAGQTFQVSIVYTPGSVEDDTGSIQLVLGGQTITVNLAGSGISSQFQFQFTSGTQTVPVIQNQVSLPDTTTGSVTTVSVTAVNGGGSSATLNAISVSGIGFQLVSAPPLPQTLLPNGSINLTFTFTPPSAGIFTGYLAFGGTTVTMTAKVLGPQYLYSYTTGSATNIISPNGTLFLATAQLGQSSSTTFTITNNGTGPGTVAGIFIGEANSPFAIAGLPSFPLTLTLNQSLSFGITFTPKVIGSVPGTLHIDGAAFSLSGAGSTPPAFPGYSFSGPQGTVTSLQQPSISLSLASPYNLAVTGTLTLSVQPGGFAAADPSIQFSTGGKTVTFSIPANATAAVFANGSTSIALQTGSTSGTITLTPTFQTASGAQLTPAASQNLQLVVPPAAPTLIGVQVTAQSAQGITLAISGVTNSQSLTKLDFSFKAAPNVTLTGDGAVSVPVASAASIYFQSAAAQAFGGQFVATLPFTFGAGSTSSSKPASATVTGVSVTATNDQGTSAPVTVSLP